MHFCKTFSNSFDKLKGKTHDIKKSLANSRERKDDFFFSLKAGS